MRSFDFGWMGKKLIPQIYDIRCPDMVAFRVRRFGKMLLLGLALLLVWTSSFAQARGWRYQWGGVNASPLYATAFDACQAAYDRTVATFSADPLIFFLPITMVAENNHYDRCYVPYGNPPPGTRMNLYYDSVFVDENSTYSYNPPKNNGAGDSCGCGEGYDGGDSSVGNNASGSPAMVGDPINLGTGEAYRQDTDFQVGSWLTFRRFYNSDSGVAAGKIGAQWRHSFNRSLELLDYPLSVVHLLRPDGRQYLFHKVGAAWVGDPDVPDTLTEQDGVDGKAIGFRVWIAELRHTETYDANGVLQSVTDLNGQGISGSLSSGVGDTPPILR